MNDNVSKLCEINYLEQNIIRVIFLQFSVESYTFQPNMHKLKIKIYKTNVQKCIGIYTLFL
jgi:hypothetical protein